jgi:hypothetical protein
VNRLLLIRISPLHNVVVLRAHDPQAIEIALARQRQEVGSVVWRELRRQLDDHTARRQIHI